MTYYRYSGAGTGMDKTNCRAEFAADPYAIEMYGDYLYSVESDDLACVADLIPSIAAAMEEDYENAILTPAMDMAVSMALDDGLTYRDIAEEYNPSDIVMSAGAWDDDDMTMWVYSRILEPNGIKGIYTDDGAVVFDPSIIISHGPKTIA